MKNSTTYTSNLKESLEQCVLKEETTIILALIYRDFLCSKEEKNRLQYRDALKIKEADDELREKYNPNNIFKSRNINIEKNTNVVGETSIVVIEEKWYKKMFNIVKNYLEKVSKK